MREEMFLLLLANGKFNFHTFKMLLASGLKWKPQTVQWWLLWLMLVTANVVCWHRSENSGGSKTQYDTTTAVLIKKSGK